MTRARTSRYTIWVMCTNFLFDLDTDPGARDTGVWDTGVWALHALRVTEVPYIHARPSVTHSRDHPIRLHYDTLSYRRRQIQQGMRAREEGGEGKVARQVEGVLDGDDFFDDRDRLRREGWSREAGALTFRS